MNKQDFFALPMADQIRSLKAALEILPPISIFGNADPKTRYRNLSAMYHPDKWRNDPIVYPLAEDLQIALNLEWEEYMKGGAGQGGLLLGKGDIADIYLDGRNVKKVSRGDNDLIEWEADVLKILNAQPDYETGAQFYVPRLVSLSYDDNDMAVNTITYSEDVSPEELFSLKQLAVAYDFAPPIKALGWIWRRVLAALSLGHRIGVIHGAVTPDHIMLKPGIAGEKQHRGFVIDWAMSARNDSAVLVLSTDWSDLYPPEALRKLPATPAFDAYVAAKSMLWAFHNMPRPMQRYFERCTAESNFGRGWKIVELFNQWDDVMYGELGWNKEFVPLNFAAVDWSWWNA